MLSFVHLQLCTFTKNSTHVLVASNIGITRFLQDFYKMSIYLQCVGALSLLSGGLALRMSFFRLAGSPGESDPNSPLNKWYETQCLAAEWNPLAVGLLLACFAKKDESVLSAWMAVALTASRFTFAIRSFAPKKLQFPIGFVSMNVSYAAVFVLGASLLLL